MSQDLEGLDLGSMDGFQGKVFEPQELFVKISTNIHMYIFLGRLPMTVIRVSKGSVTPPQED